MVGRQRQEIGPNRVTGSPPGARTLVCLLAFLVCAATAWAAPAAAGAAPAPGELYGFGNNRFHQQGNETNGGTQEPNPTPLPAALPGRNGPVVGPRAATPSASGSPGAAGSTPSATTATASSATRPTSKKTRRTRRRRP